MLTLAILVATAVVTVVDPGARSESAKAAFAKAHPCPATGLPVPSCKGYVIDHIVPLCAGGPDAAENMQWQADASSYKKDAVERAYCACLKTGPAPACQNVIWLNVN